MQKVFNASLDFSKNLTLENFGFSNAKSVNFSSETKSFESFVNDARKTLESQKSKSEIEQKKTEKPSENEKPSSEISKAEKNLNEKEKSEKIDEDGKLKNHEKNDLNEKTSEKLEENLLDSSKNPKISDEKNAEKGKIKLPLEKGENLEEKTELAFSKIIEKSEINEENFLDEKGNSENQKKIQSKAKKIEAKTENKDEKTSFENENASLESGKLVFDSSREIDSSFENFSEKNDFDIEEAKFKKGKTFSLDKDGKITVNDLRTEETEEKSQKSENRLEIKNVKFDGKNSLEMDLNFPEQNLQNVSQNILSSSTQSASSASSNFQAMLQNQIQANADSFVRAGNIVLRNNDVGEIKLILHPESLGNVKIDLHLKDNTISGKIIVQTQEAFEAFKESAENLKQAFISSGFEASGFDLSFAGERQGGNQFYENENQQSKMKMTFAYEGGFADENDANERGYFSEDYPTNSVNIVA